MHNISLTKRDNSISLTKKATINLTKASTGSLQKILVGLSWKPSDINDYKPVKKVPTTFGSKLKSLFVGDEYVEGSIPEGVKYSFDLDAYAALLKNGKCESTRDIVYYANQNHKSRSVTHMGDNLVGGGEGDSEQIIIDLSKVPSEYDKILIGVNIFNAERKSQSFGLIKGTAMRIVDMDKNEELCSYKEDKISQELANCTNMYFGILYRDNQTGAWNFEAIGEGDSRDTIEAIALAYHYQGEH